METDTTSRKKSNGKRRIMMKYLCHYMFRPWLLSGHNSIEVKTCEIRIIQGEKVFLSGNYIICVKTMYVIFNIQFLSIY